MSSRRGVFIAVVGPDGVGKTTLAEKLLELSPQPTGYVHFRPHLLRPLESRPKRSSNVSPEKNPPPNRPLGWLRLGVSVSRFWIGYLATMAPLLRRGGTIVADRWAFGYIAQPGALRFFGPPALARLAVRLVPQPDLVINLAASPSLIAERKRELSEEEIGAELDLWMSLPVRQIATLDASLAPDELASAALDRLAAIK